MKDFIEQLSERGREKDKISLYKYRIGQLSAKELKEEMVRNNEMEKGTGDKIDDVRFSKWVRSLGWIVIG